jgi:hypothetical protein
MKKILFFTIAIITSFTLLAQNNPCVPDVSLQDSTFGLWPDTIQNLAIAQVDTYYEQHIQIKTPATVGEVMGDPYEIVVGLFPVNIAPLSIDSIKLVDVNGLPSVMSTYLSNPDSVFEGNALACVTLFGTPGQNEMNNYDLNLLIDGWISIAGLGTVSLYDQLGDYENIEGYNFIVQSEAVSVEENNDLAFSVSQNSPNPFSNTTSIEFNSDTEGDFLFTVINILGEVQENRVVRANYGSNKIDVDAATLSSGIYFYTLSNTKELITKKMIINKN